MTAAEVEYSPFSWEVHEDPYPFYRALREHAPAYYNADLGFWALSRHADVLAALRDPVTYSNANGVALEAMGPHAVNVMSFLAMDPPRHGRLRNLVSRGFTPRRVADLEPEIRNIARKYIDRFIDAGQCDFVGDFAGKIPMDVISEMLGVAAEDRDRVRGWADALMHREEGEQSIPAGAGAAAGNLVGYLDDLVKARRRQPGSDDLTAALLAAEVDGDRLTDDEVRAFLFLGVIAGNETTTKLLGNALYCLSTNPDQRELVDRNPLAEIPGWIEETLRYDASSQMLARTLTRDVELHGCKMLEGQYVALLIGSANRDERVFDEPDRYDIRRQIKQSLAFGNGTHFCLGASLARLEARVCLEEIWKRLPSVHIDYEGLVRVHSGNVRGYAQIPVTF